MAKIVFLDTGQRCYACQGGRWMQRYRIEHSENGAFFVDMHAVCVGPWLMKNPGWSADFVPGETS